MHSPGTRGTKWRGQGAPLACTVGVGTQRAGTQRAVGPAALEVLHVVDEAPAPALGRFGTRSGCDLRARTARPARILGTRYCNSRERCFVISASGPLGFRP